MAINRKDEARALDAAERELVEKSHHPALQDVPDAELPGLIRLLRERRDRAQRLAHQRRREIRGKGAPRGSAPAAGDEGSRLKLAILAAAVRRLNGEHQRRRRIAAADELAANARKALALRRAAEEEAGPAFNTRHARKGMRNKASRAREDLIRPMELGRQRKAAAVAQAKRDAR